jgi:mRNA interferase MazF
MLRGEVRMVDLNPVRGAEADKRRPAVIVSNDAANRAAARLGAGVVTVVPITSSVARVYPFQVLLPEGAGGLSTDSKAQAEQVRSLDASRVGEQLGRVSDELMTRLDGALRLHLAL